MPHLDPFAVPEMSEHAPRRVVESLAEAGRVRIGESATGVVVVTTLALSAQDTGSETFRRRCVDIFVQGARAVAATGV
jgi:hypothetical protein